MAMTPAERKRRQRERMKSLDVRLVQMELAAKERETISDQTEYLLSLVYKDRDMSQKELNHAAN